MVEPILFMALSLALAALLTPLVRWVALNRGWVAHPSSDRWHKKPTALMGGIAIFAAIAIPLAMLADPVSLFRSIFRTGDPLTGPPSAATVILLGAAFLFALGLFDDFRNIKPHNKLIGQILAAALVVFLGFRLHWFNS
jgi:UDP-GlcNAc:undecaprenyl-phosphate/decaprenyl-phosphate GlcNAc-1-phosphate transferase